MITHIKKLFLIRYNNNNDGGVKHFNEDLILAYGYIQVCLSNTNNIQSNT